ncbi:fatty acid hydroxylase [Novosphingobium nitrogenifigens DSM 19370]|uniref:Fatty acid hydroxylase n=1 Tax=Novosphingobium nitrogenifigens DSM 19370 TaxID=983920 RepID=F1ZDL3_9SPHN|nr:sterol desaturase family protein [Novosphingobium nitrogenifigens]EGD57403.1 fatty acid hydroxylase [Novosphingobium nitrogenifigens DSM 19370]
MDNPFGLAAHHRGLLFIMLAAALAEALWRGRYDIMAFLASLGILVGQQVLRPLDALFLGPMFRAIAAHAPVSWPAGDWRTWVVAFVGVEFAYYWFHRLSHRVRWMWATHAVHHSSTELVLPAALRLGWTGPISMGWVCYLPLLLLGFPPRVVAVLLGANLLWQFWLHTEAVGRLGLLEEVLNTPSHHRAHHSCDDAFLDCNFGGVLIVFDRLFGTFRREPDGGGLHYGLKGHAPSTNVFEIALGEWRRLFAAMGRAHGLFAKVRVALGPPDEDVDHSAGGALTSGKSI